MREYPGEIGYRFTPGADLLVRRKRGSGLVTLLLQVAGIPGNETPATAGISWLLARASLRGAGGLTGEELAQAAERLGGGLSPGVGSEAMGWGITVRADAMREAADLLRRVALEAELAATEVAVERDLQVSDARRVRDDMFHHPLQQVLARAFPGDPYGLPALGEPDVLVTIDADRVRSWAESLGRRRAVVVAVGDLERDRLLENLDPLAAWPGRGEAGGKPAPLGWEAGRGAESRRKEQTAVAMAFPAVPFGSPDRYPLAVIRALLSGLAGRLFEELRERRSLAYQVAALPWLARRGGVVLSYIATSPEREDEAREAMLAELARLAVDPITTEELERARNYAAGTVEVQRQSGGAVAAEILDAWVLGVVAELAELPERLRGVTLEDVVRVAESVFRSDRRAEYVVRGGAGRAVATGP
jgi:zinc protease